MTLEEEEGVYKFLPANMADDIEEQIFIGAIAVPQASCELLLQSSTEQWGLLFAQTSAAEHWCWVTAHLYEQQIFI
ncbi:TPA: hypothetical protein ACH3X3_003529, partial [Trebouxia sp. C0006]